MNETSSRRAFLSASLLLVAAVACGRSASSSTAPPAVEMHLVARAGDTAPTETFPSWDPNEKPVTVERAAVVTGADIEAVKREEAAAYTIRLKAPAAQRFEDLTERAVGRELAVVIDGRVAMAPVIRTKIVGGALQVTAHDPALLERLDGLARS